jgi:glycosyltransferase involved in cell wall biosynthesis
MLHGKSVSVIIPARNEGAHLDVVISRIPTWVDEILVIDGNSTDGTLVIAKSNPRVNFAAAQRSNGKGAALSVGFSKAKMDLVAIIDADGSMDPSELETFVRIAQQYDVVKGSRYLKNGGSTDLTWVRSMGNRALTKFANFLFDQNWSDMAYGYAIFKRDILENLALTNYDAQGSIFSHKAYGQGFEIETLMFTRAARRGLKIAEVPSFEHDRIAGSSNLRAIRDGVRVLICLFVERARSNPRNL